MSRRGPDRRRHLIPRADLAVGTIGAIGIIAAGCTSPPQSDSPDRGIDTGHEYLVHDAKWVSTEGPLRMRGPAGPFELYDVTDAAVLYRGQLPTLPNWGESDETDPATWHTIDPSAVGIELIAGHEYRIQDPTHVTPHSEPILPHIRYGQEQSVEINSTTYRAGRGSVLTWEFAIGEYRGIDGSFVASNHEADGESFTTYLSIAVSPPGRPHPAVRQFGNRWLLDAPLTIESGSERIHSYTMPHEPYLAMEIPMDPHLVGSNALFQWLFVHDDTRTLIVSDVFGTTVLDALETRESVSGQTTSNASERYQAGVDWLGALREKHREDVVPLSGLVEAGQPVR